MRTCSMLTSPTLRSSHMVKGTKLPQKPDGSMQDFGYYGFVNDGRCDEVQARPHIKIIV